MKLGEKMKNNPIIIVISFILCIPLFIIEIIFLIQFNISHGITREDTINLIDNMNIKRELRNLETYNDVKNISTDIQEYIFNNKELETYTKENVKAIYLNVCYGENINYINKNEFINSVNNKLQQLEEENQITDEQKEKILNSANEITNTIDNTIEESQNINKTNIIKTIMSKKTSNYLLITTIIISLIILGINKQEGYIWISIPTIIAGIIFLILALSLEGKTNIIDIDVNLYGVINSYFKTFINVLKKSSIVTTLIGIIEVIIYIILKYKKGSEENGKI